MEMATSRSTLTTATILVSFLGLIVSLIPEPIYSDSFWGLSDFVDKDPFAPDLPGIRVIKTEADSPVTLAGIRQHDRILSLNGKPIDFHSIRAELSRLQPGDSVKITGTRGNETFEVTSSAPEPLFEGLVVLDWQFVTAPLCLVLLLCFIATQPLRPPLWRALCSIIGGLGISVAVVLVELLTFIPWSPLLRSRVLTNPPPVKLHLTLTVCAFGSGLVLSILGALACREWIIHRRAAMVPAPATPAGSG
jgi:membrane-associated protease RseP (regulator of RpoE activity)